MDWEKGRFGAGGAGEPVGWRDGHLDGWDRFKREEFMMGKDKSPLLDADMYACAIS